MAYARSDSCVNSSTCGIVPMSLIFHLISAASIYPLKK